MGLMRAMGNAVSGPEENSIVSWVSVKRMSFLKFKASLPTFGNHTPCFFRYLSLPYQMPPFLIFKPTSSYNLVQISAPEESLLVILSPPNPS